MEKLSDQSVINRKIPRSIKIEKGSLVTPGNPYMTLEISSNGKLNRFGTFYFLVDHERYKITFQIGAGRLYAVKE